MNRKYKQIFGIILASLTLIAWGIYCVYSPDTGSDVLKKAYRNPDDSHFQFADATVANREADRPARDKQPTGTTGANSPSNSLPPPDEPYKLDGIEDIRSQIYAFQVEYTEDISLLNEIIQKTDKTPKELWSGKWVSADTWKRRKDRFSIEALDNGKYTLFPDKKEAKQYAYDPENNEFVWSMDYYGKTITSKAKFIDPETLVLMKISGRKVALDIYSKNDTF